MNEVANLARKLAEEAAKTGLVKLGVVMLQDQDGAFHKTEFGFDTATVNETLVSTPSSGEPEVVEAEVVDIKPVVKKVNAVNVVNEIKEESPSGDK